MPTRSAAHLAIDWPEPPVALELGRADVHVWAASLAADATHWRECLSQAELDRAAAFHFELHRRRFIVGRGLLRLILSRYLAAKPQELEFAYGPQGKPELAGSLAANGLRFNLAHSEDLAIVAVTRLGAIGVDLERIAPLEEVDELVARFFSIRENTRFQQLAAEQKAPAFFNLWTRKEAWLKATGEGIAHSLNLVEVSFLPGEPAQLLNIPEPLRQGLRWSLHDLAPASQFAAALAVAGEGVNLRCWRWEHSAVGSAKEGPSR
jgi:4'-phosphopantetheinyl transferase